jgi:energy-coupling factor transporter ATP-binding protein EcfA2
VFIGRAPEYHFLYDTLEEEMENCGPVKENFDRLDFLHLRSFQYLSYGQKMRFITSLYSTYDRNVFIFDESLSGQDSENIKVLYDIFLSLKKRGKCVILIGQDKLFFTKISTRTIYMKGNND